MATAARFQIGDVRSKHWWCTAECNIGLQQQVTSYVDKCFHVMWDFNHEIEISERWSASLLVIEGHAWVVWNSAWNIWCSNNICARTYCVARFCHDSPKCNPDFDCMIAGILSHLVRGTRQVYQARFDEQVYDKDWPDTWCLQEPMPWSVHRGWRVAQSRQPVF